MAKYKPSVPILAVVCKDAASSTYSNDDQCTQVIWGACGGLCGDGGGRCAVGFVEMGHWVCGWVRLGVRLVCVLCAAACVHV